MTYLASFEAPALADADSTLRWQLEAGIIFHARKVPSSTHVSRLLSAYLIIVDKALREYRAGRERVSQHMSGGGIQAFVEGVGHFENCINSVKRALRLLTRLGSEPDAPEIDRTIRRLALIWSKETTDVRDAIEHIDNDIVSDAGLPDGSAHLLTINNTGTRLEIGSHQIAFVALYGTLRSLFRAGEALIQALPTPPAAADT